MAKSEFFVHLSVSVSHETKAKLDHAAEKTGRPVSWIIAELLGRAAGVPPEQRHAYCNLARNPAKVRKAFLKERRLGDLESIWPRKDIWKKQTKKRESA